MNKRNYIVVDVETTGRSPELGHEIVQLSATAYNCWNLEPHESGTFHAFLKPQFPDKASDKATQIIGNVWETAQNEGLEPKVVLQKFFDYVKSVNDQGEWISRPILVGHNVSFDINMLVYWLAFYKIIEPIEDDPEVPWSILPLDTRQLIYALFETDPTMTSWNLDACLEKFNISRASDKHDAGEDVNLTGQMFIRYLKFMRECKKRVRTK